MHGADARSGCTEVSYRRNREAPGAEASLPTRAIPDDEVRALAKGTFIDEMRKWQEMKNT